MKDGIQIVLYCIIACLFCFSNCQILTQKIEQVMPKPRITSNLLASVTHISNKDKMNTIVFPDIGYEISSQVYLKLGASDDNWLYNTDFYKLDVSQYCQMFPTSIEIHNNPKKAYENNITILKQVSNCNCKNVNGKNLQYVLGSDSKIYLYKYDEMNIELVSFWQVPKEISKIENQQFVSHVQILLVGERIVFMNKDGVYVFDSNNQGNAGKNAFVKIGGFQNITNLHSAGMLKKGTNNSQIQGNFFWIATHSTIEEYMFYLNNKELAIRRTYVHDNFTIDAISAVYFCHESSTFFVIAARTLYIFSSSQHSVSVQYSLEGVCTKISKIKKSLYLSCRYQKILFMTQLYFNNNMVYLNRYYDEYNVQGLREVVDLGQDRVGLIGDQQMLVIGQGINRNVLIWLQDKDKQQNKNYLYAFLLFGVNYLSQYSNQKKTSLLLLTENSMQITTILYEPPEVECSFKGIDLLNQTSISLLALINTTHCVTQSSAEKELDGSEVLCKNYYPFTFDFKGKEYEQRTVNLAFALIMISLGVLLLICGGCGIKIRGQANGLLESIKKKMQDLRKKHEENGNGIKKI